MSFKNAKHSEIENYVYLRQKFRASSVTSNGIPKLEDVESSQDLIQIETESSEEHEEFDEDGL